MAAYLAKHLQYDLFMIGFMYGQRAEREILAATTFSTELSARDFKAVDISFMKDLYGKSGNMLTSSNEEMIPGNFDYKLVVPIRNAIFITISTAWAMSINADMVAFGAHLGDMNYPDCRLEFANSIAETLNLADIDSINSGFRKKIEVWCPALEGMTKSDLVSSGFRLIGNRIFDTWSCYLNGIKSLDGQVLQCGTCESCINRKIAISNAGIEDKTNYAKNG